VVRKAGSSMFFDNLQGQNEAIASLLGAAGGAQARIKAAEYGQVAATPTLERPEPSSALTGALTKLGEGLYKAAFDRESDTSFESSVPWNWDFDPGENGFPDGAVTKPFSFDFPGYGPAESINPWSS
jgi:hypothetical protein